MKFRSVFLLVFLIALPAFAAGVDREKEPRTPPPRQQPWLWTLEQRLDLRFDPDSIRERSAAHERKNAAIAGEAPAQSSSASPIASNSGGRRMSYVIDGQRDAALFTPTEVFDALLFAAFNEHAGTRDSTRDDVNQELAPLHVSAQQFWDALEGIAGSYMDAKQSVMIRQSFGKDEETALCSARADALSAARLRFGAELFDRILYKGVAMHLRRVFSVSSNREPFPDLRARLIREEGGCR